MKVIEFIDLIMITQHSALPQTHDEKVLVDIDLSILGESMEHFDEYDRQVRQEYAWVADDIFKEKRREVLGGFWLDHKYLIRNISLLILNILLEKI